LDLGDNGVIAFHELRNGLYNASLGGLQYNDFPILLTEDDWTALTENGKLLNDSEDGEIDPSNFRVMLQRQLSSYIQRQIALVMTDTDPARRAMFGALKLQLRHLHRAGLDGVQEPECERPMLSAEISSNIYTRRILEFQSPSYVRKDFWRKQTKQRSHLSSKNSGKPPSFDKMRPIRSMLKILSISLPPWSSKYW
jgi:hypothetical protein